MKRHTMTILVSVALAAVAFGQPGPDDRPGRRRERGRNRGERMGRMLDHLADDLQLDEQQRTEFEEIKASHRQRMREQRPHWEEIRQAMRSGDETRAAELRTQMPEGAGPWDSMRQAIDELEPILNDEQYDRLSQMRERMDRGRQRREVFRRMARELPDELEMDEAQRAQFEQLMASRRDRMRGRMGEMRPLWEEMRNAHEAGDQARVEELRSQMEAARPDLETMRTEFFEEVKGFLRENQKSRLDAYYEELSTVGRDEPAGPDDLRTVLRAARKVKLGGAQKAELKAIGRQAMKALRALRRAGRPAQLSPEDKADMKAAGREGKKTLRDESRRRNQEAKTQLATETKEKIMAMLDAEQTAEYKKQFERLASRPRKRG